MTREWPGWVWRCWRGSTSDDGVLFSVCRMGGIPAVGGKGENLLLFIGIIDILQSYRSETELRPWSGSFYVLLI